MVEKFRGIIPPGSIWYRLNRDETIALLKHQGEFDNLAPDKQETLDSSDIQAIPDEVEELEQLLTNAGLKIVTLHN
jgi:hypothetical protein